MDDTLAINIARTKIRDAYNSADFDLLRSVLDEGLVNFSDGAPCWFGSEGIECLRSHFESERSHFEIKYTVIIIEIRVTGETAVEYGWQILDLKSRAGGEVQRRRERYADVWQKKGTEWRLTMHMTNQDVPMTLAGKA